MKLLKNVYETQVTWTVSCKSQRDIHVKFTLFFITINILSLICPCLAASSDVLLPLGTDMDWVDSHIDNNLIATYYSSSMPAEIMVYNADGTLYQKIPLTNDMMDLDALEFSDSKIYFSEYNSSELIYLVEEVVYSYDLLSGEKEVIYEALPYQRITRIASDGDYVVMRGGTDDENLILRTISTGRESVIFTSNYWIVDLAMDGDHIVWGCSGRTDGEDGREIHVYTISSGEDYIIPDSRTEKTYGTVDISGNKVVWIKALQESTWENGEYQGMRGSEVMVTDLDTGATYSVEQFAGYTQPHISGDTVVFNKKTELDFDNSNTGTIRVYDTQIGTFGDNLGSDVSGVSDFDEELVVWHRFGPRTDWISSISGTIPPPVQTDVQYTDSAQQNSIPESPLDPVVIISAAVLAGLGYGLVRKMK